MTDSLSTFQGEDPHMSSKTAQCSVTCMYQAHIGGHWRTVTALWTKNMMNHSLNIFVESVESSNRQHCKIDLKPWHFWGKKSYKTFDVDGLQIDVYWDLRTAKFSGSPEPCSDFYVALVCDEEAVLLIGDLTKKVYKRTKSRPGAADTLLFFKKEHVFGKKNFATRAKLDKQRKDYEIVVESSTLGPKDPEMWISIDGIVLIHIRNLQWKFRGNETVMVNKQPVEILWDVHAWLFMSSGSSHGLFIFKPDQPKTSNRVVGNGQNETEDNNRNSVGKSHTPCARSKSSECCVFLYAWKIE